MTDSPKDTSSEISGLWSKIENFPDMEVAESLCCWTDLLGFGQNFYQNNWKPTNDIWKSVYERLTDAYKVFYPQLIPFTDFALTLNDGIVRCCDIERLTHLDYLSIWLRGCVWSHNGINENEKKKGLPGVRTILTFGERLKHSHTEITIDDFVYNYTKKNPEKLSKLAESTGNPAVAINPAPLQMNTAFSKAYILDAGGSKIGLGGSHFYIDGSVLDFIEQLPEKIGSKQRAFYKDESSHMLFAIPSRDDFSRYHLGFELAKPQIEISNNTIQTAVWKLTGFYPWDEDVKDFINPVS